MGVAIGLIINSTITYFAKSFAFSRLVVLYASGFNFILILGWRICLNLLTKRFSWPPFDRIRKRYFRKEAILVGDSASVVALYQKLNQQVAKDTDVVAALLTDTQSIEQNGFEGIPVHNNLHNLPWYIEDYDANEVIFSSDSIPYEKLLGLMSESKKYSVDFKIASKKMEVIIGSSSVDYIGDISLVDIGYRLNQAPYRLVKRMVDLGVAVTILLFSIPIWPLMFILGYRLVRVPVFFPKADYSENDDQPQNKANVLIFSKPNEPPQSFFEKIPLFFKVLKGDITIVGSEMRFVPFANSSRISTIQLKPGLLHFLTTETKTLEEQKKHEIYYIKNYSPLLDLEMILKAIFKR
jgi:lipopolysaccharide/colanic/teichoic acid biosynthesis glycosyltransferase